jgi:hypothetical protein
MERRLERQVGHTVWFMVDSVLKLFLRTDQCVGIYWLSMLKKDCLKQFPMTVNFGILNKLRLKPWKKYWIKFFSSRMSYDDWLVNFSNCQIFNLSPESVFEISEKEWQDQRLTNVYMSVMCGLHHPSCFSHIDRVKYQCGVVKPLMADG